MSRAFFDGEAAGNLTRDNILDNITLYWMTGTGASAARWYWETGRFVAAAQASGIAPAPVSVPVGFTTFPGEVLVAPRSWVEVMYPGLAYFTRSTEAAISPPGRSRSSSPPRCGLHSARCARELVVGGASHGRDQSRQTVNPLAAHGPGFSYR